MLIKITKALVIIIMLYTATFGLNSFAQDFDQYQISQNQTNKVVNTEQFTGELIKKNNNVLTIKNDNQIIEYNVNNEIKINKDGAGSALDKLQVGDRLLVTKVKESQEILSVDIVSRSIFYNSMIILWVIISLLLITGLIWFMINKSKHDLIRTTTTKNNN
jgi:competence protein ComGF